MSLIPEGMTPSEYRARAAERKAKRAEKKKELPWGQIPPLTALMNNELRKKERMERRPKKKRKKRAKKPSWKSLVKKADKAFSDWIRRRDPVSVFSGKPTEHCFHIVSRTKYSVRWDPDNAVGSTAGENFEMEFNPHKFIMPLIAKRGLEWYRDLVRRSNIIAKRTREDMENIIKQFSVEAA